ncbi:MAG: hypothetical protein GVY19_06180 [Bacteroidetes bacterium]|jgi:uncharacterized protein with ATP-grasp and redox domains|nr:hypothetical protein [Bacteroidota bacterium]
MVPKAPVINDVTLRDAYHVGISEVANVISNGFNTPSTILEHGSEIFLQRFDQADLIIAKCDSTSELLNAPINELVVMSYNIYHHGL